MKYPILIFTLFLIALSMQFTFYGEVEDYDWNKVPIIMSDNVGIVKDITQIVAQMKECTSEQCTKLLSVSGALIAKFDAKTYDMQDYVNYVDFKHSAYWSLVRFTVSHRTASIK